MFVPGTTRAISQPFTHLEHEVKRERLGDGVTRGRRGPVLVQDLSQLFRRVRVRLALYSKMTIAFLLIMIQNRTRAYRWTLVK